jgi:hypothetical protein
VVKAAARVAQEVDPQDVEEWEATRLTREREAAVRNRSFAWWTDQGSVMLKGQLPLVEGAALAAVIDAYAAQDRRTAVEARDPVAEDLTPQQRRADALTRLVAEVGCRQPAPMLGGDRPTVVVTVDYDKLTAGAAHAGVLPDGQPLSAGDLRRICCDATLIPAVLGTRSEPLDVGRAYRLVTPPIRKALTLRDRHCAFPSCDTPAVYCEAHHVRPWWAGGATTLANLVLLCP